MSSLQQLQYPIDRAIHREVLGALAPDKDPDGRWSFTQNYNYV